MAFAHGFNIHFGQIVPPADVDVFMVAPKGPGHLVRRTYTEGSGVPVLVTAYQNPTGKAQTWLWLMLRALAVPVQALWKPPSVKKRNRSLRRAGSSLRRRCALMNAGFETLVEAGYEPESAYFECMHEMKLIVDLMYEGGMAKMRHSISDTAEYGDYVTGPRIITDETKAAMKQVLAEIQDGTFAKKWLLENQCGRPQFNAMRRRAAATQAEQVGAQLRGMMSS